MRSVKDRPAWAFALLITTVLLWQAMGTVSPHAAEITDFTPDGIKQFLKDNNHVKTAAQFLESLPAEYKQHWIMISRTESTQSGTATHPRFLLPSQNSSKVFAFQLVGANKEKIEYLHFDDSTNKFGFHSIDVPNHHLEKNDKQCPSCHGLSGHNEGDPPRHMRPNWDAYDSWAGMLPFNRDRIYQNSQEEIAVKRILKALKDDPIVKQLMTPPAGIAGISQDGTTGNITIAFDPPCSDACKTDTGTGTVDVQYTLDRGDLSYPGPEGPIKVPQGGKYLRLDHSGKPAGDDEGRGVALFDNFTHLNKQRVARELLDLTKPDMKPYISFVTQAIAMDCPNIQNEADFKNYAPQDYLGFFLKALEKKLGVGKKFSDLVTDTDQRRKSLPKMKADLQAENLNGLIAANMGKPTPKITKVIAETITKEIARRSTEGSYTTDSATPPTGFMIDRELYGNENKLIALFRFFLEPLGVRVDLWSMSVNSTDSLFGSRSETYTFGDLFSKYIEQITTEMKKATGIGTGLENCNALADKSKEAFMKAPLTRP